MKTLQRWQNSTLAVLMAAALAACGGGGGGGDPATNVLTPPVSQPPPVAPPPAVTPPPAGPGAPLVTGDVATDGLNWLNYRRQQAGLSVLPRNSVIDSAALGHSNYQRLNEVTHVQSAGKPGFTGAQLFDRLQAVGYANPSSYFYGEVISASTTNSGVYLAEELITAIYHRFAIFEPRFKEIGAGAVADNRGYNILTVNFAANGGYGPGIGAGNAITWPVNGQTDVLRRFLSDYEAPDPVPNLNEVGYPVSLHVDADMRLTVTSFTMRPRDGNNINVRLLSAAADSANTTTRSAVSIVPLAVLAPLTTYDVSFVGTINGAPLTKMWSFTTREQ